MGLQFSPLSVGGSGGSTATYGTPVPNTGYVEKIYFNTSLSSEEVDRLIKPLPIIKFSDLHGLAIATPADASKLLVILDYNSLSNGTATGYVITELVSGFIFYASPSLNGVDDISISGWNPEFNGIYEFNSEVTPDMEGLAMGAENESLTDLISITSSFGLKVDSVYINEKVNKAKAVVNYNPIMQDFINQTKDRDLTPYEIELFNDIKYNNVLGIKAVLVFNNIIIASVTLYSYGFTIDDEAGSTILQMGTFVFLEENNNNQSQFQLLVDLTNNKLTAKTIDKTGNRVVYCKGGTREGNIFTLEKDLQRDTDYSIHVSIEGYYHDFKLNVHSAGSFNGTTQATITEPIWIDYKGTKRILYLGIKPLGDEGYNKLIVYDYNALTGEDMSTLDDTNSNNIVKDMTNITIYQL